MILLTTANGAPVILKRVMGTQLARPLDGGRRYRDGRPLFGPSKTWRGLIGGVAATVLAGWALGVAVWLAGAIALAALAGDLLSSFTKRRLAVPSSDQALGLDQLPEALLPALVAAPFLGLGLVDVAAVAVLFLVGELALSRLLFHLHIRDRPY